MGKRTLLKIGMLVGIGAILGWGYPPGKCGSDLSFGFEQLNRWHSPSMAGIEFAQSCRNHCGRGCYMMGYLIEHGMGEFRDLKNALKYYRKACEYGDKEGCKAAERLTRQLHLK
ncbi:MAG: hypothetical protein ABGW77_02130 [Campylobacterales bacterium]